MAIQYGNSGGAIQEGQFRRGNSGGAIREGQFRRGNSGGAIQEGQFKGQFKWQFRECQFGVAIQDEAQ